MCYIPLKQTYGTPMVEAVTIKKKDAKYWKKTLNTKSGKGNTSKNKKAMLEQAIAGKPTASRVLRNSLFLVMQSVQAMHSRNGFQKSNHGPS